MGTAMERGEVFFVLALVACLTFSDLTAIESFPGQGLPTRGDLFLSGVHIGSAK